MSLDHALALLENGDFGGAEKVYRRALAREPLCHEALHGLGLVMHRYGRQEAAAALIGKAIDIRPDRADYHYHLGEVLRTVDRHEEAIASYRRAIRIDDGEADYLFGLGNALAAAGKREEAIAAYGNAVRLEPEDAEAHNNLGNELAVAGGLEGALAHLREAIALSPHYADAHHNLSLALHETGRIEQALVHARRACETMPDRAQPLLHLGRLLDALGDVAGALACFRTAMLHAPLEASLLARIAEGLRHTGDFRRAVEAYRTLVRLEPEATRHRVGLSHCLVQLQCFAEAAAESRRALDREPECAAALGILAVCRQAQGCFEQAAELLRRALALDSSATEAAYLLATNEGYEPADRELARWAALAEDRDLTEEKRAHLLFALGRAQERRGRYDAAFPCFERGNRIKARLQPFDADRHTAYVDRLMAVFSEEFFAQRRDFGVSEAAPVFIVGMPRSGSTLVEQILCAHPDVAALGEHREMLEIVRDLPGIVAAGSTFPECCPDITIETCEGLARRYLAATSREGSATSCMTDKMLGNFLRLGVIALLFPHARVVHCTRNPLDTCVSCFTQDFAHGLRFTTDLSNLASFFRDYRRLMAHWRQVLPLSILDVRYESLVRDPETVSRDLVGFCGLPWDSRCLRPHHARRDIATASVWQARQPIHGQSVGRWRNYEAFLGPLIAGLREAGVDGEP